MADINKITFFTLIFLMTTSLSAQESTSDPALQAYRDGEYDKAIQLYSNMLADKSDDKNIKYNLGSSFYKKGTFNAAKSGFEDALNVEDEQSKSRAYYNLGNTYFKLNKPEESLEAFKNAMKFDPEDEDAKFNYEFLKSLLEEEEQKQEGDDEQKEENDESEEEDDSDKEEKESDKTEDEQKQDENNEQEQNEEQKKNQQQQQQQQEEKERTQEEYQDILDALEQQEMEALKDYITAKTVKRRQPEKDW